MLKKEHIKKEKKKEAEENYRYLKQVLQGIFIAYLIFVVAFYFLTGDQLRYRESRGEQEMPAATSGTVELCRGNEVTQYFQTNVQRLESVSVLWGTYYRENAGTVSMELLRTDTDQVLMSGQFDVATIPEGGTTTLYAEQPLEDLPGVELALRITADSREGSAVSPLMDGSNGAVGGLVLNGQQATGQLCFSTAGTDFIRAGQHYGALVSIIGAVLLVVLVLVWSRYLHGQPDVLAAAILAVKKYRFLIKQLVSRDFKTKYKRSVLGVFWSFLNPLLTMTVQYFIFSTIFKSDIEYYPAYLLIGIVSFNFFNEACGMGLMSIIGNSGLITKVYMPKYIYPLTRVMSSVVNLAISLVPMLMVSLLTGVHFRKSALLALYFLVCLILFTLGVAMLLSAAMVFFRDVQFLWNVFSMIWMYATPLFYPETIIPDQFKFVLQLNPLYYIIKAERTCILGGVSPDPVVYVQCLLMALAALLVGALVFKKTQNKFVLYL